MHKRIRNFLDNVLIGRREFLGASLASAFLLSGCDVKSSLTRPALDLSRTITRFTFGSCAYHDQDQPIWDVIRAYNPDVFVAMGDIIYADTEDMEVMAKKYAMLKAKPQFEKIRSEIPFLVTWDDHDFGVNDGGTEYPKKAESKQQMLDFFDEPLSSIRRARPGMYTSYVVGPPDKRVQIVLMDLRWFRTPLIYDEKLQSYMPNPDPHATMLGEVQWAWLENVLKQPAAVRIIVSSTQFVSADHPWEKWANFPLEKARMLALFDRLNVRNAVVVTGDMHFAELSAEKTPGGFMLYDLTSSGLNLVEPGVQFVNRNRLAIHDKSPNFGVVELSWQPSRVLVSLHARDDQGKTVITQDVEFPLT